MATEYRSDKIRNVVLLGHSHDGKTMLAEAMLFASGAVARMGAPDLSTATMDFEPEEQRRKISINLGVAFAEHNGYKINILDAPGFLDFAGQVLSGLRVAEGAVVVVGPGSQLAVGTEVAWEQCNRTNKPRIVVVNKLDKENADFYGAVAAMRESLSPRPFPLHLPIGAAQDLHREGAVAGRPRKSEGHAAAHGEQERGEDPVGGSKAEPLGVDKFGVWMRAGTGRVDDDHQGDGQAPEHVQRQEAIGGGRRAHGCSRRASRVWTDAIGSAGRMRT